MIEAPARIAEASVVVGTIVVGQASQAVRIGSATMPAAPARSRLVVDEVQSAHSRNERVGRRFRQDTP